MTTEAVMWEWLNALSDSSTRALACEGYRRTHADPTIEVVAFHTELIAAALELYRTREDKNWSLDRLHVVRGHKTSRPEGSAYPIAAGVGTAISRPLCCAT